MEQDRKNVHIASLEALLFIHGEPLSIKRIKSALGLGDAEFDEIAKALEKCLAMGDRGMMLLRDGDKMQLATKPQFGDLLEAFVKEELSEELTPASLEALSVVTYLGPISRGRLEYLRGVNSSFTLRNLLLRGLIEREPDPQNSHGYLYKPSFELLKHLGIKAKEDLPDYEKFQALVAGFEADGQ